MTNLKNKLLFLLAVITSTVMLSCSDNVEPPQTGGPLYPSEGTDILMLVVDYTTNEFVGGKELHFDKTSPSFTITTEYLSPCDFGWMKLYYAEINELIFWGDIIWMGCGEIQFPTEVLKPEDFAKVYTDDYYILERFESVFPVDTFWTNDYPNSTIKNAWGSIQGLVKTREYLSAKKVIVYEWQPSVGVGNIADRKWIFFLKK